MFHSDEGDKKARHVKVAPARCSVYAFTQNSALYGTRKRLPGSFSFTMVALSNNLIDYSKECFRCYTSIIVMDDVDECAS